MIDLLLFSLLIPGAAFMLFLVLGMWMAFHETKPPEERLENQECPHCGYNLTGNITGKCPECGKPIN